MPRHSAPRSRRWVVLVTVLAAVAGGALRWLTASDHRDSALLTDDPRADIADVYAFRSPANPGRLVLAMTVSGFIPPSEVGTVSFDPDVLYQFKIDTDGDAVEDLVIQAFVTGSAKEQVMHIRGPAAPPVNGNINRVIPGPETASVRVSHTVTAIASSRGGLTVFAGVRDDPFFFDLGQFVKIVSGQASAFNNPGTDAFAGFNVLAIVVELPISMLGSSTQLGVWGTTSRPS